MKLKIVKEEIINHVLHVETKYFKYAFGVDLTTKEEKDSCIVAVDDVKQCFKNFIVSIEKFSKPEEIIFYKNSKKLGFMCRCFKIPWNEEFEKFFKRNSILEKDDQEFIEIIDHILV